MVKKILFTFLWILFPTFAADLGGPVEEFYVECKEASLYCKTMGEGSPLIFVHDGPGISHDGFLPQMGVLAKNHKLIFYDQRGGGRSKGVLREDLITMDHFVEDLDAIVDALKIDKAAILGQGWGGYLAMNYAIAHPESVSQLILVDSLPANSADYAEFNLELVKRWELHREELQEIFNRPAFSAGDLKTLDEYNRVINRIFCLNPESANQISLPVTTRFGLDGVSTSMIFGANLFSKPFDLTSQLASLKIPTLIFHGKADPIPAAIGEHLHQAISGSKLVVIDESGHFPFVENPSPFFKELGNFLKK